jgi:hypothetical protein
LTSWLASLRDTRPARTAAVAAAALALALILIVPGAVAGPKAVPAPSPTPSSADEIQNIDQVKTAIKGYYGDTLTSTKDPVKNLVFLHTYAPDGAYVNEMAGLESDAAKDLDKAAKKSKGADNLAIVLDIDDTTLNTYSYEIYSNFVFSPTDNAAFVNAAIFPPVPGMPAFAAHAAADGYTVFFITGRPDSTDPTKSQRPGTVTNLTNAGYTTPLDPSHLFMKDQTLSWLTSCTPTCTTTQYKTLTRQHIESLGYDIVENLGDQFSDLTGGFADEPIKVPNPMYFIP